MVQVVSELVLACADLDAAIAWFERLGLRLETIEPADDPAIAVLADDRARVRLERTGARAAVTAPPSLVITRAGDGWHRGRAGMQYRDLLPGRFGGRYIASHVRIPGGGPVADYVHHHAIRFQMIYCHRGWVRVVYEGQGEPFVMQPGDCVLQPPHIRHRVLESSPGLEVIELASPASHPTHVDHDRVLPDERAEREYGGQRFARSLAAIEAATHGLARARVVTREADLAHDGELRFGFVLAGAAALDGQPLAAGDAFALPGGMPARLGEAREL
ncbi:MAG: cupin domain-containing protein, partial [Acidobacteriota bacterium]